MSYSYSDYIGLSGDSYSFPFRLLCIFLCFVSLYINRIPQRVQVWFSTFIIKNTLFWWVIHYSIWFWYYAKFLQVRPSSRGACGGSLHSSWGRSETRRRLHRTHSMSMDFFAQSPWLHRRRWKQQQRRKWPSTALWEPWRPGGKEELGCF